MALRRLRRTGPETPPLFDPATIDLVSTAPDGSAVVLHVVADQPWTGSDEQLRSLRAKIHNYVGFAMDGQMNRTYPETSGVPWRIEINAKIGPPDPRTAAMVSDLALRIEAYGGSLLID